MADFSNVLKKLIMSTNASQNEIKEALNLISKDPESGREVVWTSSNPSVIAVSGKVTRPRWDESPENVTLTANVGEEKYSFDLTVLPDKYIGDPMKVSDETFFGTYENGVCTALGQLDYEKNPKLSAVEEAAKQGDYTKAKQELLIYMREKIKELGTPANFPNRGYADYMANGCSENCSDRYYGAEGAVLATEYEKVEVELHNVHGITAGGARAYCLMSKSRDSVSLTIAGSDYPDEAMRPKLMVYVDGEPRYYTAKKSAVIRAGEYSDKPLNISDELTVKMMGHFLSNDTYRGLIHFDFSDLTKDNSLGEATLILYAKKSNPYSEPKEFYVMREPDVSWDTESVTWLSIKGLYYNFNGIDGGNHWKRFNGTDIEYSFQTNRFGRWLYPASEYYLTGNEKYAYNVIFSMMSFMQAHATLETYEDANRLLDSNLRLNSWIQMFKLVINSKYMTPEICTAMLKRFYGAVTILTDEDGLLYNSSISRYTNVVRASTFFNEYRDSKRCLEFAVDWFERGMDHFFFEDGAYFEDTGGYNRVVVSAYIAVKRIMIECGIEMSEKFNKTLHNAVYFNLLLQGPNGETLGYGDELPGKKSEPNSYGDVVKWYNDPVLEFLDTLGEKGEEPKWTSRIFPDSTYVFLRSDWSKDAQMLFTNVRNGTIHGHNDDNGIILFGYGRNLLTDAGYATYTACPERTFAVSSLMHNTVEINGVCQKKSAGSVESTKDGYGTTDAFEANDRFDLVSQSSRTYEHIESVHKRTIIFIKPDFYIVSDLMTPKDKNAKNTYKQVWHMAPDARLRIEGGKVYSNYEGEGNLIVCDADNSELLTDQGIYTIAYGSYINPKYAYYYKEGAGDMTFDTVLLPYKKKGSDVKIERIAMKDVKEGEATALKIKMNKDGEERVIYYMLDYKKCGERTFGKYKTDAEMAIVIEDKNGTPLEFIKYNGSYIK